MNHVRKASKGTRAFHIWPQWGNTLVHYCIAGLSGWVLNAGRTSEKRSPRLLCSSSVKRYFSGQ
jgi:hypothetical protein